MTKKNTTPVSLTGEAAAHLVARQCLELVAHYVQAWEKARNRDDLSFDGSDVECDFAMQLVGQEVDRLRAAPPPLADFDWVWFRMAAPVRLALKCYSKPNDIFGTLLAGLAGHMERLPELWEVSAREPEAQALGG